MGIPKDAVEKSTTLPPGTTDYHNKDICKNMLLFSHM